MEPQPVEAQATLVLADVWRSLSEIAELKGVSTQAISKRVKKFRAEGLLQVRQDGSKIKVNLVEFDRLIGATTDPAQALRNPGGIAQPTTTTATAAPETVDADDGSPKYSASRALRESYQAEGARLDLEERTGRLADKDEVEARTFGIFRRARDRFLSLPALCAGRVRGAPDDRAARAIMEEEVRKVLDALAADLDRKDAGDDEDEQLEADIVDEDVSDAPAGDRSAAEA